MSDMTLAELTARAEISERLHDYCRSMDRIDHALGKAVWHTGGTADYGDIFHGTGAEFVDWVLDVHAKLITHSHQLGSIGIRVNGDKAASEAYVTAVLRAQDGANVRHSESRGRYMDSWSRRDGRWAIDHRIYRMDASEERTTGLVKWPHSGARDKTDPSYKVFGAVTDR
jgi:hypothetical protein